MHCTLCGQPTLDANSFCQDCSAALSAQGGDAENLFRRTDATRLLSAACYLNPIFRSEVYENYVEARYKAIAPSFGLNLAVVVRHCADARRRAFVRNLFVTALVLACLLLTQVSVSLAISSLVMGLFLISLFWELHLFNLIRKHLTKQNFDPEALGRQYDQKLGHLRENGAGNLIVYSGFNPFVGSGVTLNSWNFCVDVQKGKEFGGIRSKAQAFTIPEAYEAIGSAVSLLGLRNCSIADEIHISGKDVRHNSRFLPRPLSRPVNSVEPDLIREGLRPFTRSRHYRCVRVVDWSGDLVISFFFRIAGCGHSIFVEGSTHLVTPIEDLNRTVEHLYTEISLLQIAKRIAYAVAWSFVYVWWSPANVLYRLIHPVYRFFGNLLQDWLISEDLAFDYGATKSLREMAAGSFLYRRYGQKLDGDMTQKILEQTALDALVAFLDEHGVDTSDLKERETTLLNNGVIMSGGKINAEAFSVGSGARSIMSKIRRNRKKAAAAGIAA